MWITVLTAFITSVITTVIVILVGEPLRMWVRGEWRERKLEREAVERPRKILDFMKNHDENELVNGKVNTTTGYIHKNLFKEKIDIHDLNDILEELEDQRKIIRVSTLGTGRNIEDTPWLFSKF